MTFTVPVRYFFPYFIGKELLGSSKIEEQDELLVNVSKCKSSVKNVPLAGASLRRKKNSRGFNFSDKI